MKQNKMLQSGRSMVEMLGTLAIIGVLSVGGIAGYSYGMDKYRANETINDVNLRGIDLVRQVATNQPLSLSEWPAVSKAGYSISEPFLSAEGDAYFSISGVPQRVCEMVYAGIQNNQTTDVEVNEYVAEDSSACDKAEDNKMGFFFITNAGEGGTNPDELCKNITCPEGNSCTHGICMSEEVPQLETNYNLCNNDNQCGECEYCSGYRYCLPKDNGQSCRNNPDKICQNRQCIDSKVCTDNSKCDTGYFCGKIDVSDTGKICIKAEFYKMVLHTGEDIYMSKTGYRAHGSEDLKRIKENADAMCQSIGMEFIDNYENRMDVVGKLAASVPVSAYFFSKTQNCGFCSASYCGNNELSCSTDGNDGFIVCVKENKVYDGDIVWDEEEPIHPEMTTETTTATETTTTETTTATETTTTETTTATETTTTETTTATETTTTVPGCYSNEECDSDEYCAPTAPTCTEAFPSGAPGTCKSLDFNEYKIVVNGVNETWYAPQYSMHYWEAMQACNKIGANMVDIDDLMNDVNMSSPYGTGYPNDRVKSLYAVIGIGDLIIMTKSIDGCSPVSLNASDWFVSSGNMDMTAYGSRYKALCYK